MSMIAMMLLGACPQDEKIEEAGNVRFVLPKGWTRESRQGAVWLLPPDVPKDTRCAFIIFPGEELKVPPREWFDDAWKRAFGGQKVDAGEVEHRKGDGVEALARTAMIDRNGSFLYVSYMVFTPGSRVESMLYMSDRRDLYERHAEAAGKLVSTLGFANLKKPGPAPEAPTTLEGAWRRGDWVADVTGGPGSRTFQIYHLFFYKDGLACRQWTAEGQDGLDAAKAMAASEKNWGWWGHRTEKDGVVTVRWTNGGESTYVRKDNGSLQEGSSAPYLALPPVDKLALDGLYRYGDGKPADSGGKNYEIRFTPDGRFEESNLMSTVMREGPERGSGKYRIAHYTLYLEYDGGRTVRMGFYVIDKPDPKIESIYLNTFIFSRAK